MTLDLASKQDLEMVKMEILQAMTEIVQKSRTVEQKEWLTEKEACKLLGVSKSTMQNYRFGGIIPFSQIGNKIYLKHSDIVAHLERNYVGNTIKQFSKSNGKQIH